MGCRNWRLATRRFLRANAEDLACVYMYDFVIEIQVSRRSTRTETMESHLGEFEQLVLLALLRLGREGYGVTVRQELQQRARRRVSLGTVYKTLLRLESKGLVSSQVGDPTPERGGRRKKHYLVTAAGRRALEHALTALRRLSHGLAAAWDAP